MYSSFKNKIGETDLVDIQLISNYNGKIRFWLCVIDIYSKYALVVSLKDKKKVLQLLILFKRFHINLDVNETQHG